MDDASPDRRGFLQTGALSVVAAGLATGAPPTHNGGQIPLREFGRTKERVSALALGGHAATNPKKLS